MVLLILNLLQAGTAGKDKHKRITALETCVQRRRCHLSLLVRINRASGLIATGCVC